MKLALFLAIMAITVVFAVFVYRIDDYLNRKSRKKQDSTGK